MLLFFYTNSSSGNPASGKTTGYPNKGPNYGLGKWHKWQKES